MTDRNETRAATHADDCWSWGPAHYDCAVREIERLRKVHQDAYQRGLQSGSRGLREMYDAVQAVKRQDAWDNARLTEALMAAEERAERAEAENKRLRKELAAAAKQPAAVGEHDLSPAKPEPLTNADLNPGDIVRCYDKEWRVQGIDDNDPVAGLLLLDVAEPKDAPDFVDDAYPVTRGSSRRPEFGPIHRRRWCWGHAWDAELVSRGEPEARVGGEWELVYPDGTVAAREPTAIKALARLNGYKPTVEALLAYEQQGYRIRPATPPPSAVPEGLTARDRSVLRFALHRFMGEAYARHNEASQKTTAGLYAPGAAERFYRDAKDAERLLSVFAAIDQARGKGG